MKSTPLCFAIQFLSRKPTLDFWRTILFSSWENKGLNCSRISMGIFSILLFLSFWSSLFPNRSPTERDRCGLCDVAEADWFAPFRARITVLRTDYDRTEIYLACENPQVFQQRIFVFFLYHLISLKVYYPYYWIKD